MGFFGHLSSVLELFFVAASLFSTFILICVFFSFSVVFVFVLFLVA